MSAEEEDVSAGQAVEEVGLVDKYLVFKRDGTPLKDQVFVLRPTTDPAARAALLMYAREALRGGRRRLAEDIMDWVERIEVQDHIEERLRELGAKEERPKIENFDDNKCGRCARPIRRTKIPRITGSWHHWVGNRDRDAQLDADHTPTPMNESSC